MGVYLSEPETSKDIHTDEKGSMRFVSGEMQGIYIVIKVGERTWRMLPYINLISGMEMLYSLFSMAMEVTLSLSRPLGQQVCC